MSNIYEWNRIGERIKAERKNWKPGTLQALADKIGTTRQALSNWEKGKGSPPSVQDLINLCNVFGCEMGYLLCEYDCKTRSATDIKKETGLSEAAIVSVKAFTEDEMTLLNELLSNNRFRGWLSFLDTMVFMTVRAHVLRHQAGPLPAGQAWPVIVSSSGKPGYYEVEGDTAAKLYEAMAIDTLKSVMAEIVDKFVSDIEKENRADGND